MWPPLFTAFFVVLVALSLGQKATFMSLPRFDQSCICYTKTGEEKKKDTAISRQESAPDKSKVKDVGQLLSSIDQKDQTERQAGSFFIDFACPDAGPSAEKYVHFRCRRPRNCWIGICSFSGHPHKGCRASWVLISLTLAFNVASALSGLYADQIEVFYYGFFLIEQWHREWRCSSDQSRVPTSFFMRSVIMPHGGAPFFPSSTQNGDAKQKQNIV